MAFETLTSLRPVEANAMRFPRLRFNLRNMMLAVAVLTVPLMALSEEAHRRRQAVYHEREEAECEQKAIELDRAGRQALAAGRPEEAARLFPSSSVWAGQAANHGRMKREYRKSWWLPRP